MQNLQCKLGDNAESPTYILNEPRLGYQMEKGETTDTKMDRSPQILW